MGRSIYLSEKEILALIDTSGGWNMDIAQCLLKAFGEN